MFFAVFRTFSRTMVARNSETIQVSGS